MLSYIKLIYSGYKYYKNTDIIKDKNYRDRLKCIINDCGLYVIKAFQLAIPYIDIFKYIDEDTLNDIKSEFNMYYDMCNIHDLEYTKQLYKRDFDEDIYDKYSIHEIIGSGSVAQVYKIKCKKTNNYYAMKVVHPINKYHEYIIYLIYNILNYFNLSIINIDIYKLIKDIYSQFDLVNEVNNILMFKSLYETDIIKAPNIIKFSKNIIIMDYIEKKEISLELKNTLITIIHNIQYYYDWFHGDLHKGNMIFNDDKLYVVDFSSSFNTYADPKILRSIHYNVNHDFYVYALKVCDPDIDKKMIDKFIKIYDENKKLSKKKCFEHRDICSQFVLFCKNNNIILDGQIVNIIFNVIYYDNLVEESFNDVILRSYDLCNKYKIYCEYFKHIEKDIKENIKYRCEKYKDLEYLIQFN